MHMSSSSALLVWAALGGCSTIVTPAPEGLDGVGEPPSSEDIGDTFSMPDDTAAPGSGPSGQDPNADPAVEDCEPLLVPLTAAAPSNTGNVRVGAIAMSFEGFTAEAGLSGFIIPDGPNEIEVPGLIEFTVYNAANDEVCTVFFPASGASPVPNVRNLSPDAWVGWSVTLNPSEGRAFHIPAGSQQAEPCPRLHSDFAAPNGSRDIRDVIADVFSPVVLGLGPLTGSHRTEIQDWVVDGGVDWQNAVAPYAVAVHAGLGTRNLAAPTPWGMAYRYASDCARVEVDGQDRLIRRPHPTSAWPGGFTRTFSPYVITFTP